jgi:transcription antitermination factor NusG
MVVLHSFVIREECDACAHYVRVTNQVMGISGGGLIGDGDERGEEELAALEEGDEDEEEKNEEMEVKEEERQKWWEG